MAVKKKKSKSKVNQAGNYTKPTMRKRLFNKIKAGSKGGKPGQWSARKAQMLAKQYKAAVEEGYIRMKILKILYELNMQLCKTLEIQYER